MRAAMPVRITAAGKRVAFDKLQGGIVEFPTEAGRSYHIEPGQGP